MLFIVCVVLFGEINEIEPIQYSMILPVIVNDEITDAASDWMGLFRVDCDHYMLRPVDLLINDVENNYLIYNWILFLSSEASRGQMVGRVASFFDVYY
ncbi:MAG: hypothetical protein K8S24_06710 [Candidatus Aegiribacteria sp.]|nr:hypothetical protein [Candidatus Aegiribacteria sp.]